ncbi:MAG TPA: ATP-binding protein [Gemmatimonadales bacterium]
MALTRAEARDDAAVALGELLGGDRVIVFVRDEQVGALLPAPGFPQTLPDGRTWRRFVEACAAAGEGRHTALTGPDGGGPCPAHGISCGADVVAVVLGTDECTPALSELRDLLPLLASTFRGERAAANADAQVRLARQTAAHAEALAHALDAARGELQRALAGAEVARREAEQASRQLREQATELEAANMQLQEQAGELEAQAEELMLQAEELQRANTELSDARRAAEAANRTKSDFLATMSHELRTPLNAIGGHVQLIQLGIHGPVTDAQRAALERVDRSQRHLLGLINSILNLARIEAGRLEYRLTEVRLADALADVQSMIEPQIAAKQLRYVIQIPDPGLAACADGEKLQQILLNLLSNAVKFTPPAGAITVECATDASRPGTALVHIKDTGIGIPEDRLADIFEPFVQVDVKHSREGEGTGLGLAISRDLARGMGGDLTVESAPGLGSTFTLTLPRA